MDLHEVVPGAIGKVYWYRKATRELKEHELEMIRKKSISDTLNATLINMMHEPGKAIQSLDGVIQRGWDDAKQSINILENGTELSNEYVLIGESSKEQIESIEKSEGFLEWLNPYLIYQIKEFKND